MLFSKRRPGGATAGDFGAERCFSTVLFQEIKEQTSFKFFYNDTQEKDMGKITISVKNETVENVLDSGIPR